MSSGLLIALFAVVVAHAVVERGDRLVARLLEIALHQLASTGFRVLLPVVEVAEHVGRAADRQRRMGARREGLTGIDQVDGAERRDG